MTLSELQSMTVIQLRKVAKENHVVLGAGIDKSTMVEKIAVALNIPLEPVQQSILDLPEMAEAMTSPASENAEKEIPAAAPDTTDTPVESVMASPAPVLKETASIPADFIPEVKSTAPDTPAPAMEAAPEAAVPAKDTPAEPRFQAAWRSADAPSMGPHASYASTGTSRPAWQNTTPSGRPLTSDQRPQPLRPHSFGPRFGPAASRPASESAPAPAESAQPAASPLPGHRVSFAVGGGGFGPAATPAVSPAPAAPATPAPAAAPVAPVSAPVSAPAPAAAAPQEEPASPFGDAGLNPSLEELLTSGEFEEGGGILELHPDGYGFLRASNFMPSSRDIYVSMAQIRRFSLRTGDLIQGKIRPQRDGDKYAALLYIDSVNGMTEEEAQLRPHFEELTAAYPTRRMSLEAKDGPSLPDMRLIDLIAPLGFGQRGLLLCPPDTGKRELLKHYANTITANYPDVSVLVLMIDITPEDVTEFRESVSCPVLASTFDQAPETHLRLTEMVVERAMRLVEQEKDVVILADSLTRLAKIYSTSAVQQGRSVSGMVNPASLLRAKRMFGAARSLKEGGSLTVIAAMDIASGNKVDDSVVEEFKGTANMELMLDAGLVRAGISPAINLARSFTKNSDLLLNDQQKEALGLIRQVLGTASSAQAIPQLLSMMEKTKSNLDLLDKIKDWFKLMGV